MRQSRVAAQVRQSTAEHMLFVTKCHDFQYIVQMADHAEQCNEEHTRHLLGMQRGRLLVVLLDKLGLRHAARHSTRHRPHWGRSCMQGVPLQSTWLHALLLDVPLGHGVRRGSSQTRACRSAHAGHVSRLRLHDGLLLASCLHA